MSAERIEKLFIGKGLGTVRSVVPVSGGFLHRMYRVETERGVYAVKHLNPNIMKRPDAMRNMKRAEELERILEDAGLPIVPAIVIGGSRMQALDGESFYIFRWQNGQITDWQHITAEQCRTAGSILGRIHAIDAKAVPKPASERFAVDWAGLIRKAEAQNSGIAALLAENEALLRHAETALNAARVALPGVECITDEDMDPKNVMWDDGKPYVIDLECLAYGNPVSSALQLSLQWAGVTTCDLGFDRLKAFFDGYLEAYDDGFRDYDTVFGLAYTWLEWLVYNVKRALGENVDDSERETGVEETKQTLARIRYLSDSEAQIRRQLRLWFAE